jgi:tungstate transport system substrate-binding protein
MRACAALGLTLLTLLACGSPVPALVLATTTSVGNSGLLDRVLPAYRDATVRPVLVGSGRALEMLAAGTADVVISHAPEREAGMLATHPSWRYRKILFNDFLLVGPPADPAGVAGARDAVAAMRRIAAADVRFLSRGDESGTHERERALWSEAGVAPAAGRLIVAGAGMGQTLRVASSTAAYTLTDRGTFEALRGSIGLVILHQGDDRLLNTYAVIADPARARGAAFAEWLSSGAGWERLREAISDGEVRGFTIWPDGADRDAPGARPGPPVRKWTLAAPAIPPRIDG